MPTVGLSIVSSVILALCIQQPLPVPGLIGLLGIGVYKHLSSFVRSMDNAEACCSICYDAILSQPTAALNCGHVYHASCVESWLAQCTGGTKSCPQCKASASTKRLRRLKYDVVPVLAQNPAEVRRELGLATETRQRKLEDYRAEIREARAERKRMELERISELEEGTSCRDQRKELENKSALLQQELDGLKAEEIDAQQKLSQVRDFYQKKISEVQKRLPIHDPRDVDADALEEKRKLRHMPAEERASSLHKELVNALSQKAAANNAKVSRISCARGAEKEVVELRLKVDQLQEMLRKKAPPPAQDDSVSIQQLKKTYLSAKAPKPAPAKHVRAPDEDDMLQFAGPAKLRRTSSTLLLAPIQALPATASFKQRAKSPPPKLPVQRSKSLRALFAAN